MRFSRLCVVTLLAAAALLVPSSARATQVTCEDVRVPVTAGLLPATMYGRLCTPHGAGTVQVLIPGGTYNGSYWDIAYTPETRSFRLAMNDAGYATLAIDRLGTGQSSKPLSALLTATVQANAVHQVIQTLRPRFSKVIVGGHSIGAAMAMIEAGFHHDVDGVLVTDMTHRMNYITVVPVLAQMIPAPLDPQLGGRGLDAGYLTTAPGTRYTSFHAPGPDVPGAIAFDESTKDVFATTEAIDTIALTTVVIPASAQINVPVLLVVGSGDSHFCGLPLGSDCSSAEALRQSESPYFAPAAQLRTYLLDGYGHSINYAPNAPDFHQAVKDWLQTLG
ncbi:Pimeloyl-ACP methyl ester carboxylesterase [Amycolatopsis xylanica]|uniref:Pimeloyl-ACP methyl ester carboxylesterase n=1 Tax=Amycolatopsis xylanica TaxID=589385 RepID=A0A1H3PAV9_9PSEU|nr:Pimeloyl-ACP methyl ester carboxylesterase [Amycolatopsis xylanica]